MTHIVGCWTFLVVSMQLLLLRVFLAASVVSGTTLVDSLSRCRQDLGMHSRQIPDAAITASSSYDEKNVGPLNARIRTERNGGAWCPKTQIARDVYEWLEVDLGELKIVTLVETQGRFGNGQGQEYATSYRLEYQREDEGRWFRYKNQNGSEILKGNINTYIAEVRELRPPIVARRIRFVPHSNHPRTVCMRVELFGCTSRDGIVSYSMRQGDRRGNDLDLSDMSYDGDVINGQLSGGLGQLTDMEEGHANFRLQQPIDAGSGFSGSGVPRKRGYEWVGWRSDYHRVVNSGGVVDQPNSGSAAALPSPSVLPAHAQPVEIRFSFDGLRRVYQVRIHTHNAFSKDVAVFRAAELHFEPDDDDDDGMAVDTIYGSDSSEDVHGGREIDRKSSTAVYFDQQRDNVSELPRYVTIQVPPGGRLARHLRLVLYFDLRWILISEIQIQSERVNDTIDDVYDEEEFYELVTIAAVAMTTRVSTPPTSNNTTTASLGNPRVVEIDLFGDEEGDGRYSVNSNSDVDTVDAGRQSTTDPRHRHTDDTLHHQEHSPDSNADLFMAILLGTAGAFVVIAFIVGIALMVSFRRKRRFHHGIGRRCRSGHSKRMVGSNYAGPGALLFKSAAAAVSNKGGGGRYSEVSSSSSNSSPQQRLTGLGYSGVMSYASPPTSGVAAAGLMGSSGSDFLTSKTTLKCTPTVGSSFGGYSAVSTCDPLERVIFVGSKMNSGAQKSVDEDCEVGLPLVHRSSLHTDVEQDAAKNRKLFVQHPVAVDCPSSGSDDLHSSLGDETSLIHAEDRTNNIVLPSTLFSQQVSATVRSAGQPRSWMKYVEKLGDGIFGEVYICEVIRVPDVSEESPTSSVSGQQLTRPTSSIIVAVKTLRSDASQNDRMEFDRVVKLMSAIDDGNIARLLGVCRQMEPHCILMEYLPHGDMHQFLLHRVFDDGQNRSRDGPPSLSYGCLIYMATQIASGMKFLSEMGIVHRDLAARNCLIGSQLKVKVADFGLTLGATGCRYSADYFHLDDGSVLPVRWAAWESIVLRQFSSRSDVWSFGITLWEMMTFARNRPFDSHTDQQLINDYNRCYRSPSATPSSPEVEVDEGYQPLPPPRLPQPRICPREIYDLLLECWNVDAALRPTFREIHMFLTRKGLGYRQQQQQQLGLAATDGRVDGMDNPAAAVVDLMA